MKNRRRTYVYFFTGKRKYPRLNGKIRVKIGIAYDVGKRRRQLQTGRDTLLVQYRPPLWFDYREDAVDFETWAHQYASKRGERLIFPGGREFFEISPSVVGEIVAKYKEITGRKPLSFFIPKPIKFVAGLAILLFLAISFPLRPLVWLGTVVGIYCKEKYGITPAGWLLVHLFLFFLVIQVRIAKMSRFVFAPIFRRIKRVQRFSGNIEVEGS